MLKNLRSKKFWAQKIFIAQREIGVKRLGNKKF